MQPSSPKRRLERMNKRLQQALGTAILTKTGNPLFKEVSITEVQTSRDYKNAKVLFSCFSEDRVQEALRALNASEAYFRQKVTEAVELPYTPKLNFVYDKSLADANRLNQLMDAIRREREEQNDGSG